MKKVEMITPTINFWRNLLDSRQGGAIIVYLLFLGASLLTRTALALLSWHEIDHNPLQLLLVFSSGLLFDLAAATYFTIPTVLYLALLPQRWFRHRIHQMMCAGFYFLMIYLLLIVAAAEWLFWQEFGSRFNFIAVDYLVYTHEVIGNIIQSFPVPIIFSGLLVVSLLLVYSFWKSAWRERWFISERSQQSNWLITAGLLVLPILSALLVNNRQVPQFANIYDQELAKNGIFSLFAEFRNNELTYDKFYLTVDNQEAFSRLHRLLHTDNAQFLSEEPTDITHLVKNAGEEKRYNIIQITVESLNANYLGAFGNPDGLTPNLDEIAEQGMLFTNLYATGNRTVRGMEALTLSFPPTPGQSIVKRPNNENLFTLGSVLRSRGYDTAFLYGGYGYFDNMNYFFSQNGYRVIDRRDVSADQITFSNIWGVCDEDLFNWAIQAADETYASGKPFFQFVMTTSNHRPYTYPSSKIDIPSHTGRGGAVKYTDYAIGEFLKQAAKKPWFQNTLFVIVADHCASSAGKTDLPVSEYHIPLLIYNPFLIKAQKVTKLCSQIDVPPTILGLLNWTYTSRFYGKDILKMQPNEERALIATYQKLGYLQGGSLAVLQPIRQDHFYQYDLLTGDLTAIAANQEFQKDAISYYETASYLFTRRLQREFH